MNSELPFRILAAALLVSSKIIRARTQRAVGVKGIVKAMGSNRVDTALFITLALAAEIGLGVYIFFPGWISEANLSFPILLRWTGVPCGLGALVLLSWADRSLGRNFSVTLQIKEDHTLITSGPYRWIRHPIYTTALLISLSFFMITANWIIGTSGLMLAAVLMGYRAPREEKMLILEFGDQYLKYMEGTGRFFPRIML